MQGRAGQMRDRRLQGIKAIIERQQGMPPEGATMASSPMERTVDLASFGPVGRSETLSRFVHLATVFWLMPAL